MDATEDGRRVKVMPVVDEYTRECLSLEGRRSIKAEGVIDTLRRLFAERGTPDYLRSDNGPEFIAAAVKEWLASSGVQTLYIEPGSPWENAYSETFVSRLRDELLERELFVTLKEALGTARGLSKALQSEQAAWSALVSDPVGVRSARSSTGPEFWPC